MAKYKLVYDKKRYENGVILKPGDVVSLSHYTPEEIKRLIQEGQYELVDEPKKAVK